MADPPALIDAGYVIPQGKTLHNMKLINEWRDSVADFLDNYLNMANIWAEIITGYRFTKYSNKHRSLVCTTRNTSLALWKGYVYIASHKRHVVNAYQLDGGKFCGQGIRKWFTQLYRQREILNIMACRLGIFVTCTACIVWLDFNGKIKDIINGSAFHLIPHTTQDFVYAMHDMWSRIPIKENALIKNIPIPPIKKDLRYVGYHDNKFLYVINTSNTPKGEIACILQDRNNPHTMSYIVIGNNNGCFLPNTHACFCLLEDQIIVWHFTNKMFYRHCLVKNKTEIIGECLIDFKNLIKIKMINTDIGIMIEAVGDSGVYLKYHNIIEIV